MSSKIHIRLAIDRTDPNVSLNENIPKIYTPGEVIIEQAGFMRLEIQIRIQILF